jgi:hypothetical protein
MNKEEFYLTINLIKEFSEILKVLYDEKENDEILFKITQIKTLLDNLTKDYENR